MKVRNYGLILSPIDVARQPRVARYNPAMNRRTQRVFVTALLLAVIAGCGTSENEAPPPRAANPQHPAPATPGPPAAAPIPPGAWMNEDCELAIYYKQQLQELLLRYTENHPDVARLRRLIETSEAECSASAAQSSPSGQWVERDGQIVCDGYLTRFDDHDYCSAEAPDDWTPFSFDGELYYLQPLENVEPGRPSGHARHGGPGLPTAPPDP